MSEELLQVGYAFYPFSHNHRSEKITQKWKETWKIHPFSTSCERNNLFFHIFHPWFHDCGRNNWFFHMFHPFFLSPRNFSSSANFSFWSSRKAEACDKVASTRSRPGAPQGRPAAFVGKEALRIIFQGFPKKKPLTHLYYVVSFFFLDTTKVLEWFWVDL